VPALAALAAASARPSVRAAALSGALFGLAALVRSAPVYFVPMAAALLVVAHGRRALAPAAALVGALALVVAPWWVRNARIYGAPIGLDDLAVANLLQVSPNDRFLAAADLDLASERGWRTYYSRLQRANGDRALSRRGGEILRSTLADLAAHPGETARRFGGNLASYLAPLGDEYFRRIVDERRPCRVAWVTDAINAHYLFVLALGLAGFVLAARDRRSWPLALWFVFNAVIINLLFHPEPKYRFPTLPVPMVFAGFALVRAVGEGSGEQGGDPLDPAPRGGRADG
jgi:4-amino-4-deoxy-L-arabinose transferase-like glycosyltransferase